jgi:hypothetical protein
MRCLLATMVLWWMVPGRAAAEPGVEVVEGRKIVAPTADFSRPYPVFVTSFVRAALELPDGLLRPPGDAGFTPFYQVLRGSLRIFPRRSCSLFFTAEVGLSWDARQAGPASPPWQLSVGIAFTLR